MSKRFLIAITFFILTFVNYSFADIQKVNKLIEDKKIDEAKETVEKLLEIDKANPQLPFRIR